MKVQKLYLFLILFSINLTCSKSLQAQKIAESEIYAGYGVGTIQDIDFAVGEIVEIVVNTIFDSLTAPLEGVPVTYEKKTTGTYGVIGIGYNRYVSNRWSIGVLANYQGFKSYYSYSNGDEFTANDNYWTMMLRTDFRWVYRPKFQAYTSIAGGGTYIHRNTILPEKNKKHTHYSIKALQATLLGLRFGRNRGLGGYVELGFGSNGVINGGLTFKL